MKKIGEEMFYIVGMREPSTWIVDIAVFRCVAARVMAVTPNIYR